MRLILFIVAALIQSNCTGSLEDSVPFSNENIKGEWIVSEVLMNEARQGVDAPSPCELHTKVQFEDKEQFNILWETGCHPNGMERQSGKWTVSDDKLELSYFYAAGKEYKGEHEIIQLTSTTLMIKLKGTMDVVTLKRIGK